MLVKDWMTAAPATLHPSETLLHARSLMISHKVRHLPVVENGEIVGVLSDRDMRDYTPSFCTSLDVYEMHYLISRLTVHEAMTQRPVTIAPDEPIAKAGDLMLAKKIGSLLVAREGRLQGILTESDLLRALISAERREPAAAACVEARQSPAKPGEVER